MDEDMFTVFEQRPELDVEDAVEAAQATTAVDHAAASTTPVVQLDAVPRGGGSKRSASAEAAAATDDSHPAKRSRRGERAAVAAPEGAQKHAVHAALRAAADASEAVASAKEAEEAAADAEAEADNAADTAADVDEALLRETVVYRGPDAEGAAPEKRITHEYVLPPDMAPESYDSSFDRDLFAEAKPAKEYPFELDPFQKRSVYCIERNESVLVSAHTSAGKTVVAEYAIAKALRDNQRVIYTSPIKALSNQKYRDLYEQFSDVGLMTGDVTISPNASCLVMTTEILRSMLYRGSEIVREVAWVIYDEIHYMRDKERGVVWEESIIMLPHKVRFVFLSATIPNAREFAGWIANIHLQPCHVVYTEYRPTPLQHYLFPAGGEGLYLVVDEKSQFREDNFQKALSMLATSNLEVQMQEAGKGKKRKSLAKTGSDLYRIVKMVMERNYDPVIVFSFSKRECEAYAMQMAKLDFTTPEEKKLIEQVYSNAVDSLADDDKKLPQVESILPLLQRGIGIHHGGLLPLIKEVIEILFQESLVKCLFATETFAMGINMPAKTVVFTACRKFDGTDFRWVSAGEYIQMSGRAGRRGLDDRGIVIQMLDEKMEPHVAKEILKGTADPLNSTFHLGYNMLLNLLRVEDADPEYMIRHSFFHYQSQMEAPAHMRRAVELEAESKSVQLRDEAAVTEFAETMSMLRRLHEEVRTVVNEPAFALPFLQPGRVARIRDGEDDWGWGIVVNFNKKADASSEGGDPVYVVDVLLKCATDAGVVAGPKGRAVGTGKPRPCPADEEGEMLVVPVLLPLLDGISSVRLHLPKDLRPLEARQALARNLNEARRRLGGEFPLLDPIADMHIDSPDFAKQMKRIKSLEKRLARNPLQDAADRQEQLAAYERRQTLLDQAAALRKRVKGSQSLSMRDTLKRMKRVLRRLGLTNADNVVELKGRVACEISTADELVVTELIFNGVFNDLTMEQTVALASCLVHDEKDKGDVQLRDELQAPLRLLQDAARRVAEVCKESKIALDVEEYVASFRAGMMEVAFAWVSGSKFADICKMTTSFEGTIIRAIRRLEELLRQMCMAARVIGNTELEDKFARCIAGIKRDIVFAASLYL